MPLITSDQLVGVAHSNNVGGINKGFGIINYFFNSLGINSIKDMAIFVVLFMIFKHICIISLNYFQFKIIFENDIWLRNQLLEKYLSFEYLKFNQTRSSELIRNTADQVGQISYGSLLSLLIITSEATVVIVLLSLVLFSIPIASAVSIIIVFMIGLLPFYIFKRRMILLGKVRFNSIAKTIGEIQNIYNLYVEIRLYKLKSFFLQRIKNQSIIFANAQIQNNLITNIPKGIIEIAAVAVILVIVVTTNQGQAFLPTIAIIVTSIFRITPSFTRISSSLTQYKFSIEQINILHDIIITEGDIKANLPDSGWNLDQDGEIFNQEVVLSDITFTYDSDAPLLVNFNLGIRKGDFVILKGKSGKGKSTIIKIIMGLIRPSRGQIIIDGHSLFTLQLDNWHHQIGYVPQKPVIIEGTLRENICLGLEDGEFNQDRYREAVFNAQLEEILPIWEGKILSEEGGSISGGQAQRLGIARALYRQPKILFLDEPTSALDSKNAQMIISVLSSLSKNSGYTIVIITHSNEFDAYASKVIDL